MGTPLSRSPGESERSAESLRGPGFGRASRDIDELLSEIFLGSLGLGPHIYVYVYVSFVCKDKGGLHTAPSRKMPNKMPTSTHAAVSLPAGGSRGMRKCPGAWYVGVSILRYPCVAGGNIGARLNYVRI